MKRHSKFILTFLLAAGLLTSCQTGNGGTSYQNGAVKMVELDETYRVLEVGESFQLTVTVTFKDGQEPTAVETNWVSSNSRVAEVTSEGLVTALRPGTATISYLAGYKMASCSVVVPGADSGTSGSTITPPPGPSTSGSGTPTPTPTTSEGPVTSVVPGDEDELKTATVYFFIDYNNIDSKDTTGTKLLAKFKWYGDRPLSESGLVPQDPTSAMDPAFPYFIGWSNHTVIDSKADLWDIEHDVIGNDYSFYLYGIWSDVSKGEFVK